MKTTSENISIKICCYPIKTFTIRSQYKFGLTESTKSLMTQRDNCRKKMKGASTSERQILHVKYKMLRNKVNSEIRKDNVNFNSERIKQAKDENEIWKVVSDITKPNADHTWNMKTEEGNTNDEQEISNTFNTFFTEKITKLKAQVYPE